MIVAHVIALDPTYKQAKALARAAGCARFAYNWGLREWDSQYKAGKKPNAFKLRKEFNAIKHEKFPWIYESPKDANQQAFNDLGDAFKNFFNSCSGKRKGPKIGYPTPRKKGQDDSFYVSNDKFSFKAKQKVVRLPVIGNVKTFEAFRFEGKILSGRVSKKAGRWYLSVQVEAEVRVPNVFKRFIVGVDLGIKTAVVTSNGEAIEAPKPLKASLAKLRRASRSLSRKQKGSSNRRKAALKVAKIHAKVVDIRKDFMHKVTTKLCRENQTVVIEDLNVSGMLRNHRLARAISDVGFGMFRTFMAYKAVKFGSSLVVADRWYPSSKRCSSCGNVKGELSLSEREYVCEACGVCEDRDVNAAMNLEMYPGLLGNNNACGHIASIKSKGLTSCMVEAGTNPCSLMSTF